MFSGMSGAREGAEVEELEFKWVKKRGIGKINKDVRFYQSFMYDGLDYTLHDCVYLHKEGEPEPYIGKLIKIYEDGSKSKIIRVQWFFRPSEIAYYLKDTGTLENELFLASGMGDGLSNRSPLEAIAGKCNVICISTDDRNPQPSDEERRNADYVFYRTFDVKSCTISDRMDDMVGGLDVKFVFNRRKNGDYVLKKDTLSVKQVQVNSSKDGEATCKSINGRVIEDSQNVGRENDEANSLRFSISEVQVEDIAKPMTKSCSINEAPLKRARFDGSSSSQTRNSESPKKDMKLDGNFIACRDTIAIVSPNETSEIEANQSKEKEKLKCAHDTSFGSKDSTLVKKTSLTEGGPQKKAKIDDFIKMSNNIKLKEKAYVNEAKSVVKDHRKEKTTQLSNKRGALTTSDGDDGEVKLQMFEVLRRPIVEKNIWMKLPWEERMKTAFNQGKLVLLQNLDPENTSGDIEDIIWNAFKEECSAKMVQHTAISNPHAGQAFVILKTKEAANELLKKLNDRCLMLPNQRPLVASRYSPNFEKQSTFVGHLTLDRAKHQARREMKEAVSTSHYSQNNTIEYEMAMQWRLLQLQSDKWWSKLYEQQDKELANLKKDLKYKDL